MSYTDKELNHAYQALFCLHYDFQDRYAMAGHVGDITDMCEWLYHFLKDNFNLEFNVLLGLSMKNVYDKDKKDGIRDMLLIILEHPILKKYYEL